jgi:GH25 family lysozyme M1 (1,4-beta-N-acetylmuramidase)
MMAEPIVIDTYAGDGHHDWTHLPGEISGCFLKASQGIGYRNEDWLARATACARGVRLARPEGFLIGWYHYLDVHADGEHQARYFFDSVLPFLAWAHVDDFVPMVDVEYNPGDRNSTAPRGQFEDVTSAFASVCASTLGRLPILYTGAAAREKRIASRMGCGWLVTADYNATLPESHYTDIGWDREHLLLWQFAGDGEGHWPGYRHSLPAFGKCDLSVAIAPEGPATMTHLRRATMGAPEATGPRLA